MRQGCQLNAVLSVIAVLSLLYGQHHYPAVG
jgi:hypothetical protein